MVAENVNPDLTKTPGIGEPEVVGLFSLARRKSEREREREAAGEESVRGHPGFSE